MCEDGELVIVDVWGWRTGDCGCEVREVVKGGCVRVGDWWLWMCEDVELVKGGCMRSPPPPPPPHRLDHWVVIFCHPTRRWTCREEEEEEEGEWSHRETDWMLWRERGLITTTPEWSPVTGESLFGLSSNYSVYACTCIYMYIRESVDSLCRDGADTPIA